MTDTREDLAEKASEFLLGVLERMGVSADIDIKDDTDKTVLEIQTQDTELVIGRRGVVLDALQHLVNKAVFKEKRDEKTKPLVVDAGGFRDKQVDRLRTLAQRMSEKALETKQIVELQPMSPFGWYQLAHAYHRLGQTDRVANTIRKLAGFEPKVAKQLERETGVNVGVEVPF